MKKISSLIGIFTTLFFISCSSSNKKLEVKYLGYLYNTLVISLKPSDNYDTLFVNSDTMKFQIIEDLFVLSQTQIKGITDKKLLFEMNDSVIIRDGLMFVNDEKVCCKTDTLKYYIERVNDKNYMFIIYEGGVSILEIKSDNKVKERKRIGIDIPTWNVKIGSNLNENSFKDSVEIYVSDFSNYRSTKFKQIYLENPELEISTLQFPESKERTVIQVKNNISEIRLNEFIDLVKAKYRFIKIKDTIGNDKLRKIEMKYDGLSIEVNENKPMYPYKSYYDFNTEKYTLEITDYYELSKSLIKKKGLRFKMIKGSDIEIE